ncbi:hypothetical protein D6783_02760 [Candidatus Woesearchaeota archaeon]|nr:MAG: hypothetical protein D6783_02760 [Candidatus Woesearchaeota archaeon]
MNTQQPRRLCKQTRDSPSRPRKHQHFKTLKQSPQRSRLRKGQLQQVFIYLSALLVIIAIIILGATTIMNLLKTGCDVQKKDFDHDLARIIENGRAYGSYAEEELSAPCSVQAICLIDPRALGNQAFTFPGNTLIQEEVRRGTKTSLYYLTDKDYEPRQLYLPALRLNNPTFPLCLNATAGTFTFSVTGKQGHALVTPKQ